MDRRMSIEERREARRQRRKLRKEERKERRENRREDRQDRREDREERKSPPRPYSPAPEKQPVPWMAIVIKILLWPLIAVIAFKKRRKGEQ